MDTVAAYRTVFVQEYNALPVTISHAHVQIYSTTLLALHVSSEFTMNQQRRKVKFREDLGTLVFVFGSGRRVCPG